MNSCLECGKPAKNKYCCCTCANLAHGRDPQVQSNKVTAMRQNTLLKQGVDWPSKTPKFRASMDKWYTSNGPRKVQRTRFNWTPEMVDLIDNHFDVLVREHTEDQIPLKTLSIKYGFSHAYLSLLFHERGIPINTYQWQGSRFERYLRSLLDSLGVSYGCNDRQALGGRYELDVIVPQFHLAFEINGLYWHSEPLKGKKYHLDKHQACIDHGIHLQQYWDSEIIHQWSIVQSMIKYQLHLNTSTIAARDCSLITLNDKTAEAFLNINHIQGAVSSRVKLGLEHNGMIVAVMTFSGARFSDCEWELSRFATLLDHKIPGAAAKLFQRFIRLVNPQSIVSYSDRRLFKGGIYHRLGFIYDHTVSPRYWYWSNNEYWVHHRMGFQHKHLKRRLTTYDSTLTEYENMVVNGWDRVWDCGQDVWIWSKL